MCHCAKDSVVLAAFAFENGGILRHLCGVGSGVIWNSIGSTEIGDEREDERLLRTRLW